MNTPPATAGTAPSTAAAAPASNAPSSFEGADEHHLDRHHASLTSGDLVIPRESVPIQDNVCAWDEQPLAVNIITGLNARQVAIPARLASPRST